MGRLFLLFTILPAVELYLLLQLGSWMGPLATVWLILLTGALGAAMARQQGLSVLMKISEAAQQGHPPGGALAEGALVVAGGLLLITPGVLTDAFGFAMILPPTRRWLAPRLVQALASRVVVHGMPSPGARPQPTSSPSGRPPSETPPQSQSPFDHPVA